MPTTFSTTNPTTTNPTTTTHNPALLLEMQVDEMLTHLMQLIDNPARRQAALSAANSLANVNDARRPYMRLAVAVMAGMDTSARMPLWSDPTMMPGYEEGQAYERRRNRSRGGQFICAYCDYMWVPRFGTPYPQIMVCDGCTHLPREHVAQYRHENGMEPR